MILPWVEDPQAFGFDAGVDSIAVSGHKFIGSPMPCGVVLARRRHVDRVREASNTLAVWILQSRVVAMCSLL